MIDFTTVTREFRGLVDRRRDIYTFLGSGFAAMSLFLTNALEGKFPPTLQTLQESVFSFFALVLMVLSLLLALRMARLHGGMVLNGVLYARLMQNQDFTRPGDPARSARLNVLGVSFIQIVLVNLIAGFATFLLLMALHVAGPTAAACGVCVFALWMMLYLRFHQKASAFALHKAATEDAGPVRPEDWREHVSLSLQQANQGMIGEIAFAGLMVFSGFGVMSGLGQIKAERTELAAELVREQGPLFFAILMTVTCLLELVIYLRIRVAVGNFSLQLDPTDRPFRPLRLTDSLMGYILLAFLFAVSLHVLLTILGQDGIARPVLLGIDVAVLVVVVLAEQLTLVVAGRRAGQ